MSLVAASCLIRHCRQLVSRTAGSVAASKTLVQNSHRTHATASDTEPPNRFYELRTYIVKPSRFQEFLKLTYSNIHPRLEHSKLIGYWVTDLGGLNEVVHIWEYDSFAQRTAVRAALAQDEVWNSSYFSKMLPMLDKQENVIIKLLPWKPLQDSPFKEGGIYELRHYILNPGGPSQVEERIMLRDKAYTDMDCGKLMGAWIGDVGNYNSFYHLYSFENADKRAIARRDVLGLDAYKNLSPIQAFSPHMSSKILVPTPFSPLK